MATPSPWFVALAARPSARVSLFCVPHAGAGASAFTPWMRMLPDDVGLIGVQLPGRENRFRERPLTRIDEIVAAFVTVLAPTADRPYALFGHSMGAVVAFEAVREIARRQLPPPVRLFVSGRAAPHLTQRTQQLSRLPDAELLREVARQFGGIPAAVMADPEMIALFLAPLRNDLTALETHQHSPAPPIECPIVVLGGSDDVQSRLGPLEEWARYTTRACRTQLLSGGHFFLHTQREAVQRLIAHELAA